MNQSYSRLHDSRLGSGTRIQPIITVYVEIDEMVV